MNLKKIKDSNKSVRQAITNALVGMGFIVDYVDKVDSTHWSAKINNLTEIMPFVTNNSNKVIDKACDWLKQNLGVGDAYDVELIDAEGNGYIEIFVDSESEEIKDSKISVSELRKRGFSHSGVDYLSGLNWFTVYGSKEDVQKAVKDLKDTYKGKVSVKSGHLKKSNGQFEQEVRVKTSKIQDRMNLKKVKDARKVPKDLFDALWDLPVTIKFDQDTYNEDGEYQWIVKFDYLDTDEEFSTVNLAIESAIETSGEYEVVDTDEGDSCMYYFVMKAE